MAARPDTPEEVKSPCVDICRLNAAGSLCVGCFRTIEEISGWSRADEAEKRAIITRAARRKASAAQG